MKLSILPVRREDKKEIVKIFNAEKVVWPWGLGVPFWRYWNGRGRTERWHKAVLDGKIVGSVHWAIRLDNTRTIHDIVTDPAVRGQGVGRALVDFIGTPVVLKTDQDAPANGFYQHLGFEKGPTTRSRDGKKWVTTYTLERVHMPTPENPWIFTYTGKKFDLFDPKPDDIAIEDIAHALACTNRFAGQACKPISVAQHSVYVARLVEDTPYELQALLHDASEAYLGDMTFFLKKHDGFKLYREVEANLERAIFTKFGCPVELHETVARADRVMVMFEGQQAFGTAWQGGDHLPYDLYHPITEEERQRIGAWAAWPWRASETDFLAAYRKCTGE